MGNNLNEDDLDGGLSSMITSLFEGNNQRKKLDQMKTNYDLVIGRDETKSNDDFKEDTTLNDKTEEEDPNDLIIY